MATESVATKQAKPAKGKKVVTVDEIAAFDFPAVLSDNDIDELEEMARTFGRNRRICSVLLSQSKESLTAQAMKGGIEQAANAYMAMLEAVQNWKGHLSDQQEMAEIAEVRIMCMAATLTRKIEALPEVRDE